MPQSRIESVRKKVEKNYHSDLVFLYNQLHYQITKSIQVLTRLNEKTAQNSNRSCNIADKKHSKGLNDNVSLLFFQTDSQQSRSNTPFVIVQPELLGTTATVSLSLSLLTLLNNFIRENNQRSELLQQKKLQNKLYKL